MHTQTYLVSVALATYNGEKYLREQLESLLQQTYSNIEIVITDDCSKDNTVSIIRAFQVLNKNIYLYQNETNRGSNKTFHRSIENSSGIFIAFCDQDDIWEKEKIEVLVNAMGEEDLVYSNSMLINSEGIPIGKEFKNIMNLRSYYSGAPFLLSNCILGNTMMIKAAFLKELIPFPENICHDPWLSFCASANYGAKYVDRVLVRYRQHDSNAFGIRKYNKNNKKRVKENFRKQFEHKLGQLRVYASVNVKSVETKEILNQMIQLFTTRWSLKRSLFFFRNIDRILIIKPKPYFRKVLFCLKMFFKPNF